MELKVSSCVLFILLTLHAPRVRGVVHMQRFPTCLGWGAPRARVRGRAPADAWLSTRGPACDRLPPLVRVRRSSPSPARCGCRQRRSARVSTASSSSC